MTPAEGPPSLLLVDADGERRRATRVLLERAGFRVREAQDAAAALDAARSRAPDALLLESDIPQAGVELCAELRGLPGGESIPVAVIHAADDGAAIEAGCRAGATEFLARPLHGTLVEHRIRTLLAMRAGGLDLRSPIHEHPRAEARSEPGPRHPVLDRPALMARLHGAIDAAREGGHHVAIVAVHTDPDVVQLALADGTRDPEFLDHQIEEQLRSAVRAFERRTPGRTPRAELQVARIDASGFAILVPSLRRSSDAMELGSQVLRTFADPIVVDRRRLHLAVSVGIAISPEDGDEADALVRNAETACYCARQDGSDGVQRFTPAMSRWAFERLTLEHSLRHALENDELTVFYQPRVAIPTRRIVGMEALVRWRHPQLGMISPAQFIPLAEETGMIVPIGEWVLATACHQNKAWQEAGLPPVRMSVNLSAVQFRQPTLLETVVGVLAESRLDPNWLELELTESMLMNDITATIDALKRLKDAGIHLSIDDFGTGYSSLSYLKRFPIDALKIDRSFIHEVTSNPDDAAIATSIILMGHSLRLSVVAEGVEDESQLEFLRVLQCNEAQGYFFSRPVEASAAEALLRAGVGAPERSRSAP